MRLARLDLTRYGKFTDTPLDFGPARPGRPDLHVVYGPNEAGKSTAFAALLDLLFGIEKQSRYGFLHAYDTLRIGAAVEVNGAPPRVVTRIKRQQNSLRDAADQPVGDTVFAGNLGGLDRTAYRHMFSLDDETLEKGGELISASKGELGELLFAASAGLAELSQTLDTLRARADAFHRGRTKGELSALKAELDDLKAQRDALDTALPAFRKLVETSEASRVRYEQSLADLARLRTDATAVDRRLGALPRHARLLAIRARLEPLRDVPYPPAHWRDELPALQHSDIELATLAATVATEAEQLAAMREGVARDPAVLEQSARIDALGDLRDRFTGAEKDLPERRRRLADADNKLELLLRRLDRPGEPDPDRLVLGASASGALRDLIEQRSGIVARLETARSQHAATEQALNEAQDGLAAHGDAVDDRGAERAALKTTLAAVRASDHTARRHQAEKMAATLSAELEVALAALRPWIGTVDALAAGLAPRAGDVARWATAESEIARGLAQVSAEVQRLGTERDRLDAEQQATGRFAGVVPEAEIAAIRRRREAAWAEHRRDLQANSADIFEAALREDDSIVAARQMHSDAAARLAQIGQALALNEVDLAAAIRRRAALCTAADDGAVEARRALDALGWPADARLSMVDLGAWLTQRAACLDLASRLRGEQRAIAEAAVAAGEARDRLAAALAAAASPATDDASLADLLARAEALVERETQVAALRGQAADRRAALARSIRERDSAEEKEAGWQSAWRQACGACWIGEAGPTPALQTVRAILDGLGELEPLLVQRADLATRIEKMAADQARYADAVDRLTADLALDPAPGGSPLDVAAVLAQRLVAARDAEARHREIASRLAELDARRVALDGERTVVGRRIGGITAFFGVTTMTEVAARLEDARVRSELAEAARETEAEIVDLLGTGSMAEAEAILQAADRGVLEAERDALRSRIEDVDGRTRTLFAEATRAHDALAAIAGDDGVARLAQRRRTLLLTTEDKARRHLGLRIGIAAAEQALRSYRDRHRSSMMRRASDAFRTVSRGAYSGLAAQPGEKGDILAAIGPNGSKTADGLSKGTRFQLYLALRVAGYHEFCQTREPVPFVADDIMETFDDFRAEEAFRLFVGMAEVGQVIYLTHHRHLVDIARSVCPDVRVSELPAAA